MLDRVKQQNLKDHEVSNHKLSMSLKKHLNNVGRKLPLDADHARFKDHYASEVDNHRR